ncbi:MAG: carboxymuconolactone decarboxylase family protein [Candidatus Thiodiazotropha sp.]
MNFELHTIESAPTAIKPELEAAEKAFGSIPNLFRGLAANPATLKIYQNFSETLKEHGHLSPIEQQVVYIAVSTKNACTYCVAAHSLLARMAKMDDQTLAELREIRTLSDPRMNALRNFTLSIMKHRGHVPEHDLSEFYTAGFDQRHILEVLTILAQKVISNYFNHMANTPLDEMFQSCAWQHVG